MSPKDMQAPYDEAVVQDEIKRNVDDYFTGTDPFTFEWESLIQAHTNLHTNDHADHNAS